MPGLDGAREDGRCGSGAACYQAIVVLGLQVDCLYHVHPYQALLREVVFLRLKQELAGRLGGFRVLRKRVDTEEALCVYEYVGVGVGRSSAEPSRRDPGQSSGESR